MNEEMKPHVKMTQEAYRKTAEAWHADHADKEFVWWKKGTDAFVELLPVGGTVLDVGCGGGTKMRYMREGPKKLHVTGVDVTPEFLAIVNREQPEVTTYLADMHHLRDAVPGIYDGVYASASLLHVMKEDADDVLSQFAEKLKPGGYLHVSVKGMREDGIEEADITEEEYGTNTRRFSFYTMGELKERFERAGLSMAYDHAEQVGRSNWLQIIGRKAI